MVALTFVALLFQLLVIGSGRIVVDQLTNDVSYGFGPGLESNNWGPDVLWRADDFIVPENTAWTINQVRIWGFSQNVPYFVGYYWKTQVRLYGTSPSTTTDLLEIPGELLATWDVEVPVGSAKDGLTLEPPLRLTGWRRYWISISGFPDLADERCRIMSGCGWFWSCIWIKYWAPPPPAREMPLVTFINGSEWETGIAMGDVLDQCRDMVFLIRATIENNVTTDPHMERSLYRQFPKSINIDQSIKSVSVDGMIDLDGVFGNASRAMDYAFVAADDFYVPENSTWNVTRVNIHVEQDVDTSDVHLLIYSDGISSVDSKIHIPGELLFQVELEAPFSSKVHVRSFKLKEGVSLSGPNTYWISIVARNHNDTQGWRWITVPESETGYPAVLKESIANYFDPAVTEEWVSAKEYIHRDDNASFTWWPEGHTGFNFELVGFENSSSIWRPYTNYEYPFDLVAWNETFSWPTSNNLTTSIPSSTVPSLSEEQSEMQVNGVDTIATNALQLVFLVLVLTE